MLNEEKSVVPFAALVLGAPWRSRRLAAEIDKLSVHGSNEHGIETKATKYLPICRGNERKRVDHAG